MKRNIIKVLIPDAESGHAIWVCEGLAMEKNIEIHAMSNEENPALKYSLKCKSFKKIKYKVIDLNYLEAILEYAESKKIDIILPIDEPLTELFSIYVEKIRGRIKTIPIPDFDTFKIATNKRLLADFCEKKQIPVPATWELEDFKNQLDTAKFSAFPIILKPESGNGGKNVHLIESKEKFLDFNFDIADNRFGKYFIQEFIEGYDIDMSVLCFQGKIIAYTIQKGIIKRKSNFAASLGIDFRYEEKLYKNVEKLMRELNYNGIAHLDLRYDYRDSEYKVIEINSRFWGSVLGSIKAGVNFPYLSVLIGLGENFQYHSYQFIRYFDFISIIKKPQDIFRFSVKFKETNILPILKDPFAHVINILKRSF